MIWTMITTDKGPAIKIQLDKERIMRWNMRSARQFGEVAGVAFVDAIQDMKDPWLQTCALWASLVQDSPELTAEDVEILIHGAVWGEVMSAWEKLFDKSTPNVGK